MNTPAQVTQADRIAAADLLDELSSLLDHNGIGQIADLIRDGEYDEHEATIAFARHRPLSGEPHTPTEAREAFEAIIARGPERDSKWAGMSAVDIARVGLQSLSDAPEQSVEAIAQIIDPTCYEMWKWAEENSATPFDFSKTLAKARSILALLTPSAPKDEVVAERERLRRDFQQRANLCRTNLDGYDITAASVWDAAAEACK